MKFTSFVLRCAAAFGGTAQCLNRIYFSLLLDMCFEVPARTSTLHSQGCLSIQLYGLGGSFFRKIRCLALFHHHKRKSAFCANQCIGQVGMSRARLATFKTGNAHYARSSICTSLLDNVRYSHEAGTCHCLWVLRVRGENR